MLDFSMMSRADRPARGVQRRRSFASCLLAAAALLGATGMAQAATTWYVRADGGSAAQCDGRSDAKYPGSGSNQACAWSHPFVALPPGGTPRMAGGDTLMIGSGSYKMGVGAAAGAENCSAGSSWDCYMPSVPSGPSSSQPTRILGKGYDSGCSAAPELWGTERASTVLNLKNSNNVQMACLEVTDHSACIDGHSDASAKCQRSSAPFGAWAPTGLTASNSKNVRLQDINIHGMANQGVFAGGLTDWTLERVKIRANGWAGWNGDIGSGSSNAGQITMREIEVAWNGCAEKYPSTDIYACWAQQKGGYGDGLGTAKTGGNWVIEDSMFHHNTSDGLDLLYADGTGSVTVRRVHAEGNAGNQIKTNGTALIENSVVVGNCNYFNGIGSMIAGDHCRAQGNAISAGLIAGQTTTVRYNTVTGEGDCLILNVGGSSSSIANIQNNALIGRNSAANAGALTCGHYAESSGKVNFLGNLFFNVRSGQCPSGSVCSDPKLTNNTSLDKFDPKPLAGSPLIDRAHGSVTIATDHNNAPRPVGAGYDIGAIEYGSSGGGGGGGGGGSPPPPSCTRAAPQIAISTPPGSVAAGATLTYDLTVTSKDDAGCSAATFTLGRTMASGWSGTLAASSLSISPGGRASTTINVASPSSAAAGRYTFDVSAANGSYSANATGIYTVAGTPPATCTRAAPRLTLGTPSPSSGKAGAMLSFPVSLTSNDSSACAAASFSLARTLPSGWSGSFAASSLSAKPGATVSTSLNVTSPSTATAGSYPVNISASGGGYSASAAGSYTVTGTTPPPTSCTRAAPALTLGGTSPAVGYGTPVSFSVKLTNKDSSGCAATSFNLASSLPQDFTGKFGAAKLSAAPGASASTTITLTSPSYTWAAPGGYTFGVTASGNGYSTTAKSSYTVVAPVITLSSNKSTYARGETMTLTSKMTSGGKPIVSNNVRVTITKPNGSTTRVSAMTNSSGTAVLSVPLSASQYPAGNYKLYADGSVGATPMNTSGSFKVK